MNEIKVYNDLINSDLFRQEMNYLQHGDFSVYEHSLNVAKTCFFIAKKLRLDIDKESLIKGALLHDYFLYDWHEKEDYHKLHGFKHPKFSRNNAKRDFGLTKKEENMILSHMFPLGKVLPKYKESIVLCVADKYCATSEILSSNKVLKKAKSWLIQFNYF